MAFERFKLFSVQRVFWGSEGQQILGVLDGCPWFLPKHQGRADQGTLAQIVSLNASQNMSLTQQRGALEASFRITPTVRAITRQLRDKDCLAALFDSRYLRCLFWSVRLTRVSKKVSRGPKRCPKESLESSQLYDKDYFETPNLP